MNTKIKQWTTKYFKKEYLLIVAIFILSLILWNISYKKLIRLTDFYSDTVSIRLKDGITKSQFENALLYEKEKETSFLKDYVLYHRNTSQVILNAGLGRKETVVVYQALGNHEILIPGYMLSGGVTYSGDLEGCILDQKTAYDLFGSEDVIGLRVNYNDREYIIRGVIQSIEQILVIHLENEKVLCQNIEFRFKNVKQSKQYAEGFIAQNGLASSKTIIDGSFYVAVIALLCKQCRILLFLYFIIIFIKKHMIYRREKDICICEREKRIGFLSLLSACVVLFVSLVCMPKPLYFPDELIPTMWSKLEFYSENYIRIKNNLLEIRYLIPIPRDVLFVNWLKQSLLASFGTTVSFIITFKVSVEKILENEK